MVFPRFSQHFPWFSQDFPHFSRLFAPLKKPPYSSVTRWLHAARSSVHPPPGGHQTLPWLGDGLYHLVMTNMAMERSTHKWRFLAGKIIYNTIWLWLTGRHGKIHHAIKNGKLINQFDLRNDLRNDNQWKCHPNLLVGIIKMPINE